jgi:AraC family transcriptional regulator of adaptative response/methylated-DNA-[protein]-cysteine methyltransferase
MEIIRTLKIDTPLGSMMAAGTKEGIYLLEFSDGNTGEKDLEKLSQSLGMPYKAGENRHLRILRKQLKEYFRGKRKGFSVSLVTPGTEFQKSVWQSLMKIPYGKTISYNEQARLLNNPGAIRAVGHANGDNPIAIVIPCHRVIGADGSLTGYGGGLERKKWLIDHEKKHSGQAVEGTLF